MGLILLKIVSLSTYTFLHCFKDIKKLVVARITHAYDQDADYSVDDEELISRDEENIINIGYTKLHYLFKVKSIEKLTPSLYRIRFTDGNTKVKFFYRGTNMFAKYFLITSTKNQISRYYTICNSLNSNVYDQYMDAFNYALTGKEFERKYNTIEEVSQEMDCPIEIFMKFYLKSKTGITSQVKDATEFDQFLLTGPVGKGLDMRKNNIVGTNVIIIGGTGALPFLDMFSYLARKLLSEKVENGQVFFPGETFDKYTHKCQFIVYAYYPDPDCSVAYEFWEKIADLHQYFGVGDRFRFIPKFVSKGDGKL